MEPNQEPNQQPNQSVAPQEGQIPAQEPPHTGMPKRKVAVLLGILLLVATIPVAFLLITRDNTPPVNSGDSEDTSQEIRQADITITDQGFVPASLTVKAGTKVTWTNTDAANHQVASDPHPSHTGLEGLYSTELSKDASYSFTFDKPGTYTYHDHQNPFKFNATVVVE